MDYKDAITNNNLRSIRKAFGLRQVDVAEILGFQITDRISHWEKGTAVPSIVNLFKLCGIYQVSPEKLYPKLMEIATNEAAEKLKGKYTQSSFS